jgi:hypothetical protein
MTTREVRLTICREKRFRANAKQATILVAVLLAFTLGVAQGSGVTPTTAWMDIYGAYKSTFAGVPIPVGTYVAVFDPRGVQCGEFEVNETVGAGSYGIVNCYGLVGDTPGPVTGDRLFFKLNGVACTTQAVSHYFVAVPAETVVTWRENDLWEVNLIVPPRPPVTVTLASAQVRLDWQPVGADAALYDIWRSTAPYFAPGDASATRLGSVAPGAALNWSGGAGVGDPAVNYTYRIRSLDVLSRTVGISQAVAEFDFALSH